MAGSQAGGSLLTRHYAVVERQRHNNQTPWNLPFTNSTLMD